MSRTERPRYAAVVALVLLAIWGVAGCTGNGNPAASPTTTTGVGGTAGASATASGAATASATGTVGTAAPYPSDVPPEARVNSDAGAIAFTRHFFAQVNKAYTTPQSGLISPLSTPNCKSCASNEATSANLAKDGRRYDGPAIELQEVSIHPEPAGPDRALLMVTARQLPAKIIDRSGSVDSTLDAKLGLLVVQLQYDKNAWKCDSIKVTQ